MLNAQKTIGHTRRQNAGSRNSPSWRRCVVALAVPPAIIVGVADAKQNSVQANVRQWNVARAAIARWKVASDKDDGFRPNPASLSAARAFIRYAETARITAPEPFTDDDGEIGFRWPTATGLASVSFMGDGNLVAYVYDAASGKPPLELDDPFDEAIHCPMLLDRIRAAI